MTSRCSSTLLRAGLLLLLAQTAHAASVTVAWDRNTEPVAGYLVQYGDQSHVYQVQVDAGNVTTLTVDGLLDTATYYFVVQAYTADGLVSPRSVEVSTAGGPTPPVLGPAQFTTRPAADGHLTATTLAWGAVANAQAYYLYVGTAAGLKDVVDTGEIPATSAPLPALAATPTYVARLYTKQANAWRFVDMPFQAAVRATPAAPARLLAPAAGQPNVTAAQGFQWTAVADAQAYYLYVGTAAGLKDVVNTGETPRTTWSVPALPANAHLFATLWTKLAGTWVATTSTFDTLVTARLLAPAAGQPNVTAAQAFQWTAVADAQAYYLYVGTAAGLKDVVNTGETPRTTWTVPALPANAHLFATLWTKLAGGWVATTSTFDTAATARLSYPTQGASDVSASETFTWSGVTGAQAYRLVVGTTDGASDLVDSGETLATSFPVTGLAPGLVRYARLGTKRQGVWTVDAVTFTTSESARFTRPLTGDGNDLGRGLGWTPILGAEAYGLAIATTLGGHDLFETGALTTQTVAVPALPAGQPLFLRISTKLGGVWRERTATVTLNGAALITPQTTVAATGQTFTWTAITNAEAYYLGIGTTPGAKDVVDSGDLQATTFAVATLPVGRPLYVSVWTKANGVWNVTTSTLTAK